MFIIHHHKHWIFLLHPWLLMALTTLALTLIAWIFKHNKLTGCCCLQWLVSPTDRSEDRRDVWRTAERDRAASFCMCRTLMLNNTSMTLNLTLVFNILVNEGSYTKHSQCNLSFRVGACEECWLRCHCTALPDSTTKIIYLPITSTVEFWLSWFLINVSTPHLLYYWEKRKLNQNTLAKTNPNLNYKYRAKYTLGFSIDWLISSWFQVPAIRFSLYNGMN